MKGKKSSLVLLLGLLILFMALNSIPIQNKGDIPFDGKISSVGNPPEVLDLGGGIADYSMVKTEYTEPFPWAYLPDHIIYWTVEFSNDTEIDYYFFESIYGSLDGLNGTFTPLFPAMETSVAYEPEFFAWEISNLDNLVDFGHLVTCWVVDDEGAQSENFVKLFKYHNGTVEPPEEELEVDVTAHEGIINKNDTARLDYVINDPFGNRNYSIGVKCDQILPDPITVSNWTSYGIKYILLDPHYTTSWTQKEIYNFTVVLKVWDGAILNDTVEDSATIYINSPPENGTVFCDLPDRTTINYDMVFNVTCTGWVDDLDIHLTYTVFAWQGDNPNTWGFSTTRESFLFTFENIEYYGTYDFILKIEDNNGGSVTVLSLLIDIATPPDPPDPPSVPAGTIGLILGPVCVISLLTYIMKKKISIS